MPRQALPAIASILPNPNTRFPPAGGRCSQDFAAAARAGPSHREPMDDERRSEEGGPKPLQERGRLGRGRRLASDQAPGQYESEHEERTGPKQQPEMHGASLGTMLVSVRLR